MDEDQGCSPRTVRNLAGFWLLGLTNNFAYVIMLSAAHDILHPGTPDANMTTTENRTDKLVEFCNPIGTGAILIADILPALIVKLSAPMYIYLLPYSVKVSTVVLLSAASFPLVAFGGSKVVWISIIGVVCASAGSGIGEVTFLSLSSHFDRNCVSTWSSGTGAAGVFGALSYAGLTALGVSPKTSLLLMLCIPVIMALTYFFVLAKPISVHHRDGTVVVAKQQNISDIDQEADVEVLQPLIEPSVNKDELVEVPTEKLSFWQRMSLFKPLVKFMIPLMLVYFAEYFINQALFELIFYKDIWLPRMQQYRWYQVIYQIGVFISRSSVNVINVPFIFIFPVFQFVNLALLTCQVFFKYIPNIWIIFVIILFEGLMGGGAYVNTFYRISKEVPAEHREFSLGVTSISDSFGISLAAAISIPVHNYICTL